MTIEELRRVVDLYAPWSQVFATNADVRALFDALDTARANGIKEAAERIRRAGRDHVSIGEETAEQLAGLIEGLVSRRDDE